VTPRASPGLPVILQFVAVSAIRLLDSRPLRLLLVAGTGVALLAVFAERAIYTTSVEAVVNAPRLEVVAPFDGVVDSVAVSLGRTVPANGVVARLRRDEWSPNADEAMGVRATLLRNRIDIVARQLATLLELQEDLGTRSRQYRRTQVSRLDAEATAAEAQLKERRLALSQGESLRAVDGIPVSELEKIRAEVAVADARVKQLRASLASASKGVVVDESGQDAPYSQQRIDQLTIDVARLRAERDGLKAELAAVESGHAPRVAVPTDSTMPATDSVMAGMTLRTPSAGVVWTAPLAAGTRVLKGTTVVSLVDCRHVYLEATVTPRDADGIRVGQAVLVHFAGQTTEYRATVQSIRGGGLRAEASSAAQLVTPNREGDSHVILGFDAATLGQSADNFCQVGRQAKVVFAAEAPLRPLTRLRTWFDR
jgi:multidrug resistance efflux pump